MLASLAAIAGQHDSRHRTVFYHKWWCFDMALLLSPQWYVLTRYISAVHDQQRTPLSVLAAGLPACSTFKILGVAGSVWADSETTIASSRLHVNGLNGGLNGGVHPAWVADGDSPHVVASPPLGRTMRKVLRELRKGSTQTLPRFMTASKADLGAPPPRYCGRLSDFTQRLE